MFAKNYLFVQLYFLLNIGRLIYFVPRPCVDGRRFAWFLGHKIRFCEARATVAAARFRLVVEGTNHVRAVGVAAALFQDRVYQKRRRPNILGRRREPLQSFCELLRVVN